MLTMVDEYVEDTIDENRILQLLARLFSNFIEQEFV